MKYLIQGRETAPSTGKVHWQGFVIYKSARTLSAVIKEYKGIHFEVCQGSPAQNMEYCKKEGQWEEWGEPPKVQGERTDLKSIGDMLKEGASDREMLEENPGAWLHCYRGVKEARKVLFPVAVRRWEMDVRIYWGNSGCGKTRKVWDEFEDVYVKPVGKWWDGYDGQDVVLVDDFDPSNCFDIQFDFYLKLLDRYPMKVEVKGGFEEFRSKTIIFTSNFDPKTWFYTKSNRGAFFRRVKTIVHLPGGLDGTSISIEDYFCTGTLHKSEKEGNTDLLLYGPSARGKDHADAW